MLKYFKPEEFASKDGVKSPYPNVVQDSLLELLDKIREEYGSPIVVTSGYRSEAHNRAVGGVSNSTHTRGLAADIKPLESDSERLGELQDICDKLNPNGGVGFYSNFVHVDTRGTKARWRG